MFGRAKGRTSQAIRSVRCDSFTFISSHGAAKFGAGAGAFSSRVNSVWANRIACGGVVIEYPSAPILITSRAVFAKSR